MNTDTAVYAHEYGQRNICSWIWTRQYLSIIRTQYFILFMN